MKETNGLGLRRTAAAAAIVATLAGCSQAPGGQAPAAAPGVRWGAGQPPELPLAVSQRVGALAVTFDTGAPGLAKQSLPQSTNKVVLQLTSDVLGPPMSIEILPSQFANGQVIFTVHSLPAGQYSIAAAVKDASNVNLAAGATTATVTPGVTTPVSMLLTADPDSLTGGLKVSIDTTTTAGADAALTLPTTGRVMQIVTLPEGSSPAGIAVDGAGNLWVAANGVNKLLRVDPTTSPADVTEYNVGAGPVGVAIDGVGNAWVTNNGNASVHKVLANGTILGPFAVDAGPAGIATDGAGNVWVACNGTFTTGTGGNGTTVKKLSSAGATLATYIVPAGPWGIDTDGTGNAWVGTTAGVSKIGTDGTVTNYSIPAEDARHLRGGLAVSGDGSIWTANDASNNATKLTAAGSISGHFGLGAAPAGIVVDPYRAVWVTSSAGNALTKLDSQGTALGTFPLPAGSTPGGMALDSRGNPWVAGSGNGTLVKLGR